MLTDTCLDSCAPEGEITMASYFASLHAWKPVYEPNLLQPHGACKALESSAFAFAFAFALGTQLLLQALEYLHVPHSKAVLRACMGAANVRMRSLVF